MKNPFSRKLLASALASLVLAMAAGTGYAATTYTIVVPVSALASTTPPPPAIPLTAQAATASTTGESFSSGSQYPCSGGQTACISYLDPSVQSAFTSAMPVYFFEHGSAQDLYYDLDYGQPYTVGRMVVTTSMDNNMAGQEQFNCAIDLLTTNDPASGTWTPVVTAQVAQFGATDISFAPVTARYFRIQGVAGCTYVAAGSLIPSGTGFGAQLLTQ